MPRSPGLLEHRTLDPMCRTWHSYWEGVPVGHSDHDAHLRVLVGLHKIQRLRQRRQSRQMSTELVFRFDYPSSEDSAVDKRTLTVQKIIDESPTEFYKFRHDTNTNVTTIHRLNTETKQLENAGQIDWVRGHVYFGVEKVSISGLRRKKKQSSRSRRFMANGSEFKWKLADNGKDMICVSDGMRSKTIAQWTEETLILQVAGRAEDFLDRVVVTCFLHHWFKLVENERDRHITSECCHSRAASPSHPS